mgnify:CR=1 FL=1
MKKLSLLTAMVIFLATVNLAAAGLVGPGGPNYDSVNGLLSDFQQSYGQVAGTEISFNNSATIKSLTVWGLYYNYRDMTFTPPAEDDFTIRFHEVVGGDPDESFIYEQNVGAGVRTDTGEGYYDLNIFKYTFDGLNINLSAGDYLLSVIDDTVNPASNGYWHWVSANDTGTDWWRREDNQPAGEEFTFYWTAGGGFTGDRAFQASAVPVPAAVWLLGSGLMGLIGVRRKMRK